MTDQKYLIEAAKNFMHDQTKGNEERLKEAIQRIEKKRDDIEFGECRFGVIFNGEFIEAHNDNNVYTPSPEEETKRNFVIKPKRSQYNED